MSGLCSAHQGPCPYDCHINGERKRLQFAVRELLSLVAANRLVLGSYNGVRHVADVEKRARAALDKSEGGT